MSKGTSCVIFRDGITNGAAWQVVEGGMQDWSYVYTSDMELSIELGCDKYPEETNLGMYWNQTKGALLAFITQVINPLKYVSASWVILLVGRPWCSGFRS